MISYEEGWKPTKKVRDVLEVVRSLFISPVLESALRGDVAKLFAEDYSRFCEEARTQTAKFAK